MEWYYHNAGVWNVTDANLKTGAVIQVAAIAERFYLVWVIFVCFLGWKSVECSMDGFGA